MSVPHRHIPGSARTVTRTRWTWWLLVAIFALVTIHFASGCVYYNLFYNTKRTYEDAEKAPRTPDGSLTGTTAADYEKVIEKCQQLIVQHPKSKYVDDAVLLIGKSRYARAEYEPAAVKFQELQENFPNSDLNVEGQLYLGKCYLQMDDPASAASVLQALYDNGHLGQYGDDVLYTLGTALIRLDDEESAVEYLGQLAKRYPNSPLRLEADLELAGLYTERGDYDRALDMYTKLSSARVPPKAKIRYMSKLSQLYVLMGNYKEALDVISELENSAPSGEVMAEQMLLQGEAYRGINDIDKSIDTYKSVAARFPRSKFAAEAYFRMGDVYQNTLDSLQTAKEQYDQVPRQYANSPFAKDAVSRSVAITKLERLQASLAAGGTEGKAEVQFELAETEFLQFNNSDKALGLYQSVLADYPNSDVAPKAAYAIAYIYDKVFGDQANAQVAYQRLLRDYPDSQQAAYVRTYLENPGSKSSEGSGSDS